MYVEKCFVKQKVTIKTASDLKHLLNVSNVCALFDLVSKNPNFFIINF